MTRPSSKYAREGTAAHAVAEMILRGDVFLPDKIQIENEEFIVSPGMCRALNPYVSHVQSLMKKRKAAVFLEQKLYVPDTDNMVWGTLDCGVRTWSDLFITDLKYGKGHIVKPDSPQLKLYALALAGYVRENRTSTRVTLTICQPRVGDEPLHSYETTLGALWDWQALTVNPAVMRIAEGDKTENAGSHCRWCVRQTECVAFAQLHQSRAADVFDDHEGVS